MDTPPRTFPRERTRKMSTPKYNWWPFVLNMIRDYPIRKKAYDDLHDQKITAGFGSTPGGGGASRKTEDTTLRQLPEQEQKEFDAVSKAIARTLLMESGAIRVKIIKLTMWRNQFTLYGVADFLHIPESRAKQYRWEFVMLVSLFYGLIGEEEYTDEIKKKRNRTDKAKKTC